jgi:hypothetical protein
MSLLSQTDREMTITALEYFVLSLKTMNNPDQDRITQYNTLLNWIKLEHQKNEN